jgi:hypothetical protein
MGGGKGNAFGQGCDGAIGGVGGKGGAGAGGSGGFSAGVLYKGPKPPKLDAATDAASIFGAPGAKGPGGVPANDGKIGDAKKIVTLDPS